MSHCADHYEQTHTSTSFAKTCHDLQYSRTCDALTNAEAPAHDWQSSPVLSIFLKKVLLTTSRAAQGGGAVVETPSLPIYRNQLQVHWRDVKTPSTPAQNTPCQNTEVAARLLKQLRTQQEKNERLQQQNQTLIDENQHLKILLAARTQHSDLTTADVPDPAVVKPSTSGTDSSL